MRQHPNAKPLLEYKSPDFPHEIIRQWEREIEEIAAEGDVAADGVTIIWYQNKRKLTSLLSDEDYYMYYKYVKLMAPEPILPSRKHPGKLVKHVHLGKYGSEAHLEEMEKIRRRDRIKAIEKQIEGMLQYCPPHPSSYI